MGRALPAKFLPSLFTIYFRSDLQKKTLWLIHDKSIKNEIYAVWFMTHKLYGDLLGFQNESTL